MEATTWSLVFPAPYTTSGSPVRAARSRSRRANPRSATPGGRGAGDAGIVPPIATDRGRRGPAAAIAEHLPMTTSGAHAAPGQLIVSSRPTASARLLPAAGVVAELGPDLADRQRQGPDLPEGDVPPQVAEPAVGAHHDLVRRKHPQRATEPAGDVVDRLHHRTRRIDDADPRVLARQLRPRPQVLDLGHAVARRLGVHLGTPA